MNNYRTIDGLNNNELNPYYGSTDQAFIRMTFYDYADGISEPSGDDRPSAREISNVIFAQSEPDPNPQHASDLFWLWGQFIDHDITLTASGSEAFPIPVPLGDVYFDPFFTGTSLIPLTRSDFLAGTGEFSPGDQYNEITAFIDASNVYGSDPDRAAFLRDEGGKLKVSADDYLPFNDGTQMNAGGPSTDLFVAGDIRANENVGLIALHTIFVREHNRLVDELAKQHPEYDDETLYQEAKLLVEAEIQAITYNEFLPILLGPNALSDYQGYQPDIDPQIANIFATAAYRLGHTMLSSQLYRIDESGAVIEEGNLLLRDAFFRPDKILNEGGIDPILRGAAMQIAETVDTSIVDEVRNFLFGPPGSGGLDLAALNIQRGRDHGLDDYNSARVAYGLDPVISFEEITSDVALQEKLSALYGDVNNIDVFVGGLAEDPLPGSMLGELFHTVIVDQFERLRDGDSFWYQDRLDPEQLAMIENATLGDIIMRNTDIEFLQQHVMLAYARMDGGVKADHMYGSPEHDLMMGHQGHDDLYAEAGDDAVYAGNGHDLIDGGLGHDLLFGEQGNDLISGGEGHDTLYGGSGKDSLFGDAGDDQLYGDSGHDYLTGGPGEDTLVGGEGDDDFVILPGTETDYISDFNPSGDHDGESDQLDLSAYALQFEDVLITQQNNQVEIHLPNQDVVILQNVAEPQLITEADFVL